MGRLESGAPLYPNAPYRAGVSGTKWGSAHFGSGELGKRQPHDRFPGAAENLKWHLETPVKLRGYPVAWEPNPRMVTPSREDGAMSLDSNGQARVTHQAALTIRSGRRLVLTRSAAPAVAE